MITREELLSYTEAERRQLLSWIMLAAKWSQARVGRTTASLVKLGVGEHFMLSGPPVKVAERGRNISHSKRLARVILNEPEAQWTTRSTNQGLKVTRVR